MPRSASAFVLRVLENDLDVEDDPLSVSLAQNVTTGTLVLQADGTFTYDPLDTEVGVKTFTYKLNDGLEDSEPITVSIVVYDAPPYANDDSYDVLHDASFTITDTAEGVLANDLDDLGVALVATLVSGPAVDATLTLNGDGKFDYTPKAGFVGTDSFVYKVSDLFNPDNDIQATVWLNVVNDVPRAFGEFYSVVHDTPLVVDDAADGLLANDFDADGDTLTVTPSGPSIVTSHGSLEMGADGTFTYTPDIGFVGRDTFVYRAYDKAALSQEVLVTFDVWNIRPDAMPDLYTISAGPDQLLEIGVDAGVLANDSDLDNDAQVVEVTGPEHGVLTLSSDGSFDYDPDDDYFGTDSFTYFLDDKAETSDTVTVTIDVVNSPPDARNDFYRALHDTVLRASVGQGVLGNDSDFDQDTLKTAVIAGPDHGLLNLADNGSFTYTPSPGFVGEDSFTYTATDPASVTDSAEVTIEVTNTDPVGLSDFYRVLHDVPLNKDADAGVLANDWDSDGDRLELLLARSPDNGALTLNADGSFNYVPAEDFFGTDSFEYRISDLAGESGNVVVTIDVTNSTPVASPRFFTATHDAPLNVLAEDGLLNEAWDLDNESLTVAIEVDPDGRVVLLEEGAFLFTPELQFEGEYRFTYSVDDGVEKGFAEVTILVTNTAAWAVDDQYSTTHNVTLSPLAPTGVMANDRNWDGDEQTATLVTDGSHGSVTLQADGSFEYIPDQDYFGEDSFTYKLVGDMRESREAPVTIQVTNEVPVIDVRLYRTHLDTRLDIPQNDGLFSGITNTEGDTLTWTRTDDVDYGTLNINADGSFDYRPNTGFTGGDFFTFIVNDGFEDSEPVTVTIAVTNHVPLAADDFYLTPQDTALQVPASGILTNDTDDSEDTLTAVLVDDVGSGQLSPITNGSFTYTPTSGFTGLVTFTYRADDGTEQSELTTVTIEVIPPGLRAADDAYLVQRNGDITISAPQGVAANDSGAITSVALVRDTTDGDLDLYSDGSFDYEPNLGYFGDDTFTYISYEGGQGSNTVTVTITTTNYASAAYSESFRVNTGGTLVVDAADGLLANDFDDDGDSLCVNLVPVDDVDDGVLTLSSDGSFTYIPDVGFFGTDSFFYAVNDGDPLVIIYVDDPPVVSVDDNYDVHHDGSLEVAAPDGVLANDEYELREVLTITVVDAPEQAASFTLRDDGSFDYEPNSLYKGLDQFTYKVTDASGDGNTATVSLNVWNQLPTGTPNTYHVHHDEVLNLPLGTGVLANDVDHVDDTLTATPASVPAHDPNFTLFPNGSFVYTPEENFAGQDTFTYWVEDSLGVKVGPISVTLDVWNTKPGVAPDRYRAYQGASLSVAAPGVLTNDWDDDGDTLTAALTSDVAHGTLKFLPTGAFTYWPDAGFFGTDEFSYEVTDGVELPVSTAVSTTVTIDVQNRAPVANANSYFVQHDSPLNVPTGSGVVPNDWDGDGDNVIAVLVSGTSHGELEFNEDGSFGYIPVEYYVGPDSFRYKLFDGAQESSVATVSIDVWNNIPWAHDNYYEVKRGDASLQVDAAGGILADDSDWDGDIVSAVLVDDGTHGSVDLGESNGRKDGSFTYTPDPGFSGTDTFTYKAFDGAEESEVITVTIDVLNHAPYALDDYFIEHHGNATIEIDVLVNDWDPEGDALSLVDSSPSISAGSLAWDAEIKKFTFTPPDINWTGIATFSYKLDDGGNESYTAVAVIDVRNTAPVALPNSYRIKRGATLTTTAGISDPNLEGVLDNDFDADGDSMTATPVDAPEHATTFTLNPDGSFNYEPEATFKGTDVFVYEVSDGADSSAQVQVTIEVENTPPVGRMDFLNFPNGEPLTFPTATLTANDHDFDEGDTITAVMPTEAGHKPKYGTLADNGDGTWTYTPNAVMQYVLAFDQFMYFAKDDIDLSEPVLVLLTAKDDGYAALDDHYRVLNGTGPLDVLAPGVLANDWSTATLATTGIVQRVDSIPDGSLSLQPDGLFSFNTSTAGTYKFTYEIHSGATATITIDVVDLVANDDFFIYQRDQPLRGNVFNLNSTPTNTGTADAATAGEAKRAVLVDPVSSGTLDLQPDGEFLFTPAAGSTDVVTFTYKLTNGFEDEESAPATVMLSSSNSAPVASAHSYTVSARKPLVVDAADGLLFNATDEDSDRLTAVFVGTPIAAEKGAIAMNPNGSFTFIPDDTFFGDVTFDYKANDGVNDSSVKTVTITVEDEAPLSEFQPSGFESGDRVFVVYHRGQTLDVGPGDGLGLTYADEMKHSLTAEFVGSTTTEYGVFQGGALNDGSFTYTPSGTFVGNDVATFEVKDVLGRLGVSGTGNTSHALNIQVKNDLMAGPWFGVPQDEFYEILILDEGETCDGSHSGTITGDVMDREYDVDGDSLVAVYDEGSEYGGTMDSFDDEGNFTFSGAEGDASFTFHIEDEFGRPSLNSYPVTVHFVCELEVGDDTTLEPDSNWSNGARITVTNNSTSSGTVNVVDNLDGSVTITPADANADYNIKVDGADVTWSSSPTLTGDITIVAEGNVSGIATTGDLTVTASGSVGNLSGKTVTVVADNVGDVTATANLSVDLWTKMMEDGGSYAMYEPWTSDWTMNGGYYPFWSSGSGIGTTGNLTAEGNISVKAADPGTIISNAGDITFVYATLVDNPITAAGSIGSVEADRAISAPITANGGGITKVVAFDDISANITAAGTIGRVSTYRNITSAATISTSYGDIEKVFVFRELQGAILTTNGDINDVEVIDHIVSGASIDASGIVGTVDVLYDFHGVIKGDVVSTVTVGRDFTGTVERTSSVGLVTVGRTFSGTVKSLPGSVNSVTVGDFANGTVEVGTSIGSVVSSNDISGTITAITNISGSISATGNITATITAGQDIGTVAAGRGIGGTVTATVGTIEAVTAGENISNAVTAGGTVTTVSAGWNITGAILSTSGSIGTVEAGLEISGAITATLGDVSYVYAGTNITGDIDAGDDITTVAAGKDLTGDVITGGNIGTVRAGGGKNYPADLLYAPRGGSILGSTIEAAGHIALIEAHRYRGQGGMIGPADEVSTTIEAVGDYITRIETDSQIDASIVAGTSIGEVLHGLAGSGDIVGSITAGTSVENVDAGFGRITAPIVATTTYIGSISAYGEISGDITAGTTAGVTGVESKADAITANITAATDVGSVRAGLNIDGKITAGGDIGQITAGGGSIVGEVKAGGDIATIVALGPWAETAKQLVWTKFDQQVGMEWDLDDDKPQQHRRPKPDMISLSPVGHIKGKVTARSIGGMVVFGDIEGKITAGQSLFSVWALGEIIGDLQASKGLLTADAWGDISGNVTAGGPITLQSYESVTGDVRSTFGSADVTAFGSVTGDVNAKGDVVVWAYENSEGDLKSHSGSLTLAALKDATSTVEALLRVVIVAQKVATQSVVSTASEAFIYGIDELYIHDDLEFMQKAWVISMGDIELGELNGGSMLKSMVGFGGAAVVGWGNVTIGKIDCDSASVYAGADAKANISAKTDVHIESQNFEGSIGVGEEWNTPKNVYISATGDVDGEISASISIDVLSLGELKGNLTATTDEGWIGAVAAGDISGNIHANGAIGLKTWGALTGDVTSDDGAVSITAAKGITQEGSITAEGYVDVFAWDDINGPITSKAAYVDVFSSGNVNTTITAGGGVGLEVWGDLKGSVAAGAPADTLDFGGHEPAAVITVHGTYKANVTSSHHVALDVFGTLKGTITATAGDAEVVSHGGISATTVTAGKNASVTSWTNISGLTVDAKDETAFVWAQLTSDSIDVKAGSDATVVGIGDLTATVMSTAGDAKISAMGQLLKGTTVVATAGIVSVFAGGAANIQVSAGSVSNKVESTIVAMENLSGKVTAGGDVDVIGMADVNLTTLSYQGGIDVFANGQLTGTYHAADSVDVVSMAIGGTGGSSEDNYESDKADVSIVMLTAFDGTVTAAGDATVSVMGDLAGTVKAGKSASVFSTTTVSATVTAGTDAVVGALGGDVSGAVIAEKGSATVTTSAQVTAAVTAYKDATVAAKGNITAAITATTGDAEVITFGSLDETVTAGNDADVFARGAISMKIDAGNDASVISHVEISGDVSAGNNASVLSLTNVSGKVTAVEDAEVTALGTVSGEVEATKGSASVLAGGDITGTVTAGLDVTVWTDGNLLATVNAGNDADVTVWGNVQAIVTASRDADVWSFGTIDQPVTGTRHATVTAFGEVSAAVTATAGNADVTVFAPLSGDVTGGVDADAWTLAELSGNVTAITADATAVAIGNITGSISAPMGNANVTTFGDLNHSNATILAGADANVSVYGSAADVNVTAGETATVRTVGTLTGDIASTGENAIVFALGDVTLLDITATNDATVSADGQFSGNVTATSGDASLFATGTVTGTVTAGQNAAVGSLASVSDTTVIALQQADVLALGKIIGSTVTGNEGVFVWSYGGLTDVELNSLTGPVDALTNGAGAQITVDAGGDVLLASVGDDLDGIDIVSADDVTIFGFGITGDVQNVAGNLNASSFGLLRFTSLNVTGDANLGATDTLTVVGGSAGGDVRLTGYSTLHGTLDAGGNLAVWSLGTNGAELSAGGDVESLVTYDTLLGSLTAGGDIYRVYVWNELNGPIVAGNVTGDGFIGEVYSGTVVGPLGSITAATIGLLAEHDRSPFVDLPQTPVARIGYLVSLTADSRSRLLDMQQDFQQARTEVVAVAAAVVADVQA